MDTYIGSKSLTQTNVDGRLYLQVVFPADLGRSLIEAGYNMVRVHVTEEGILLKPYSGEPRRREKRSVALPAWNGNDG